jgi:hypothetical protein
MTFEICEETMELVDDAYLDAYGVYHPEWNPR